MKKISKTRKTNILLKFDGRCAYCGITLKDDNFSVDHIIAKSKGGSNEYSNIYASCRMCNTKKGVKTLDDFRVYLSIERSIYAKLIGVKQFNHLQSLGVNFGEMPKVTFYFEGKK